MMVLFTQMEELGGRTSLGREEMVSGLLDRLSEGSVKSLTISITAPTTAFYKYGSSVHVSIPPPHHL